MPCAKCDELDKIFERPRTERTLRKLRGTLTSEDCQRLEFEELAALRALQEHKITDHHNG